MDCTFAGWAFIITEQGGRKAWLIWSCSDDISATISAMVCVEMVADMSSLHPQIDQAFLIFISS